MMLEKTRSRNRQKEQKIKSTLQTHYSSIPRKSKFHGCSNPIKRYRHKRKLEDVRDYANQCRQKRLANPSEAERALQDILENIGIAAEREKILSYAEGQRFIIADFYIDSAKAILEADGPNHGLQRGYDRGRDQYFEQLGIKTYRFTNREILKNSPATAKRVREILNETSPD